MNLNERCSVMASLTTLDNEALYYHLPDQEEVAFLPLATRTLRHLQGMVATALTSRAESKEWDAKQEFMKTLERHIKAYKDYEENMDADTDSSGEDEPKANAPKRRKEQAPKLYEA